MNYYLKDLFIFLVVYLIKMFFNFYREDKVRIKFFRDMEDVKGLGMVLFNYNDEYFI